MVSLPSSAVDLLSLLNNPKLLLLLSISNKLSNLHLNPAAVPVKFKPRNSPTVWKQQTTI
jgi:hypothetical protein